MKLRLEIDSSDKLMFEKITKVLVGEPIEKEVNCESSSKAFGEETVFGKEVESDSTKSLFDELPDTLEIPDSIGVLEKDIKLAEEYEEKISKLEKDKKELDSRLAESIEKCTFHESRSNSNFEEMKSLREKTKGLVQEKSDLLNKIEELEKAKIELLNKIEMLEKAKSDLLEEKVNSTTTLEQNNENEKLRNDNNVLKNEAIKLKKDIEYHQTRSNKNFEEVKKLRNEIKEFKKVENSSNGSVMELDKLRQEFIEMENRYKEQVNILKTERDKNENIIESTGKKLKRFEEIKKLICSNEKSRNFWSSVESRFPEEN